MAATLFTGTPEKFKKKQREEGILLTGKEAEEYFRRQDALANNKQKLEVDDRDPNAAIADIHARSEAAAPTEAGYQASLEQKTPEELTADMSDLETKGRKNLQNFQVRQQYREQQAAQAEADNARREGLASSWQNNPAKSWDEAAARYNQLNISGKASEWAAEARRRQAEADAAAKDVRDRHAKWSAGAMTALTWAQQNPNDRDAIAQLSVALEDIGNSLAQEQGFTFDPKTGIAVTNANGEKQATLTWTKPDGTTIQKTFSPSSLRKAHKGEELDNVLREHWTDMAAKTMERYNGTALNQAQAAKIYADMKLAADRLGLDIQKENFQEAMITLGIPIPDGKGGYVIPSAKASESTGSNSAAQPQESQFYGYGDYGKLRQAVVAEAKTIFEAAANSGKSITWAEATKQAMDGIQSDYTRLVPANSGAVVPQENVVNSDVDEFDPANAPNNGAGKVVAENKQTTGAPPAEGQKAATKPASQSAAAGTSADGHVVTEGEMAANDDFDLDTALAADEAKKKSEMSAEKKEEDKQEFDKKEGADTKPEYSQAAKNFMNETGVDGSGAIQNPISKGLAADYLKVLLDRKKSMGNSDFVKVGSWKYGNDGAYGRINFALFGSNDSSLVVSRANIDKAIATLEEVVNGPKKK